MIGPAFKATAYQEHVLATPEGADLFLGGGRGGGKSMALALLAARHVEQYGAGSRVLYLRQSFPGTVDFETTTRLLYGALYGTSAKFNAGTRTWRFPSGGSVEIQQLEDRGDFPKFQGRSWGLILVDEAGQWADLSLLEVLRSCLRSTSGEPCRMVWAANPGGPAHADLFRRFVAGRSAWLPFADPVTGRTWIYAPSTLADNPHLGEDYQRQLEAATAGDLEMRRAWIEGDWNVSAGSYFAACLSDRSALEVDPWLPESNGLKRWAFYRPFEPYLAYDHGVSAPAVCYVAVRSAGWIGPDGRYYPRGSVLLLDEWHSCEPNSLTRGMGYTVGRIAEELTAMARRWQMHPEGVADDAIFGRTGSDAGTIADEFRRAGVFFDRARKGDRLSGWSLMRELLTNAGSPDRPGMYVSRGCTYFWQTVPLLPRDPRRPDDVDTRAADHAADAARYSLGQEPRVGHTTEILL